MTLKEAISRLASLQAEQAQVVDELKRLMGGEGMDTDPRRVARPPIPENIRKRAEAMLASGKRNVEVERDLQISSSSVERVKRELKKKGKLKD